MVIYKKLVSDRIPEIIEASGKKCVARKLDDNEYLEKLKEERNEYLESGEVEGVERVRFGKREEG